MFEKSLAIMEKVEGPDGVHVAIILNGIAGVYQKQVCSTTARGSGASTTYVRGGAIGQRSGEFGGMEWLVEPPLRAAYFSIWQRCRAFVSVAEHLTA